MILYLYRGYINEEVPIDVTHAIIHDTVTSIKEQAFMECFNLVSVIMGDQVIFIQSRAFRRCSSLRYIRISKTLLSIGDFAFCCCTSLEAFFIPSTVRFIEFKAFVGCESLRLMIVPKVICNLNLGNGCISNTGIIQIAEANAGVRYGDDDESSMLQEYHLTRVREWWSSHMNEAPFHKLCYNSSVTTKQINDYLVENGNDAACTTDPHHGMIPLHILSMNPHAPADAIAALHNVNVEIALCVDNQGKIPLDYAIEYNVGGLIALISGLCSVRNS